MRLLARSAGLAAIITVVLASIGAAQVDYSMYNAQLNLEAAWDQLQASPYDYHGHRRKALEHVGKALEEMHKAAFAYPPGKAEKDWRKREEREWKEEEKQQKREEKLERKELKREQELQERGY